MPDPVLVARQLRRINFARILDDEIVVLVKPRGDIRYQLHQFRFVFVHAKWIRRAEENDDLPGFRGKMAGPNKRVGGSDDRLWTELRKRQVLANQLDVA